MNDYIYGYGDGLLTKGGRRIFPIGFYELPQDDDDLKAMAEAGINLVRCGNIEGLDRLDALGMMGWVSLPIHLEYRLYQLPSACCPLKIHVF